MFGHCLVPLRDTGLRAPLTQPVGLLGAGGSNVADTVGKGGKGIGKNSHLPDPLEWIFYTKCVYIIMSWRKDFLYFLSIWNHFL